MFGTSSFSTEVPRQRVVSQLRVTRTLLHELSAGSSLSLSRKINPIVHVLHIVPSLTLGPQASLSIYFPQGGPFGPPWPFTRARA